MIRVFKPTDRDFTSNGDAVIVPIKARVKNNMNGEFFIELTCESKFYKYLDQGNIIITPTPQGEQAFRIDNQLSRKGERITIKARHVFYDAEKLVVADSYAVDLNCEQALKHFNAATDSTSPFTMHSDITSLNSFRCVRKSLAEAIGTVIERWGGYLVRNNWDISVNKSVGRDYGVTIRYAKNLKELTASYDFSGVATKLLPVGKDGILLPELYVSSSKQYSIPYTKVVSIQQDINEDDYSTEEEYQAAVIANLRTQAQALVNKTCIPVITYTLKGNPEKVQDIGDVIEVIDERIGVNITTQVIGYEWDVITEQYASLTFGNFGNTLSGLMAKVNADTKGVVNEAVGEVKTEFKSSINNIYDLLQGSYVLYRGYDILLLDRIPAGTAQNVIKFSKDGISVSSDGINGDFKEVYNIATKKLSVPSISLNGKDLQNTLDDKISYDNLKAGNNITITRKGKILTINSTGGDGGIRLYYGADIPANSFGSNKDIYIQLDTAMANLLAFDASHSGTSITNYSATETNRKWDITATFVDNWEYHSFNIYSLQNLTVGKKYTISFDFQNDGVPPLYGIGELFGLTLQHTNQFIDMRNWSSDLVENGEFKYFEDSYYGEWWYQSFPNDTKRRHYEFEFTARQITEYIGFYGDRTSGNLTCSLYELCVGDKVQTNEIKDVFYKINEEWLLYEAYESGDNITIVDGVISATDTDEIAELEDVSLTNLADGQILKYNATTHKWENAEDSGGSEVEANPSGTATDTLTKVGIDGTIYNIPSSGGSSVIPNPSGTPTASLNSIQIDGVIYEITSGLELKSYDYALFNGFNIPLLIDLSYDHKVEIEFKANSYSNSLAIAGNNGGGNAWAWYNLVFYNNATYLTNVNVNNTEFTNKHIAIWNDNGKDIYDGVIKGDSYFYGTTPTNVKYLIGGRSSASNYSGKIYHFKITDNITGDIIADLTPKRLSIMGVPIKEGLYDSANNEWYSNANMVLGND